MDCKNKIRRLIENVIEQLNEYTKEVYNEENENYKEIQLDNEYYIYRNKELEEENEKLKQQLKDYELKFTKLSSVLSEYNGNIAITSVSN